MKKSGLGKGLSSLIPNYNSSDDDLNIENNQNLFYIDISKIIPNVEQPRKYFDDDAITSLADSIKIHGMIQPIIVNKYNDKYLIIAGERRFRAAQILNLEKIPCIISEKAEKEVLQLSLIENIQRKDLNALEEAIAFKNLLDNFKMTQEDLSKQLSISRTSITNKIRLLKLCKIVQDYVLNDEISEGHARVLLSLENDEMQITIANKIIDNNLSVRETEALIKSILENKKEIIDTNTNKTNSYLNDLKLKLENFFGTKILINNKNNKGKIQIEYYSIEDLDRILNLINLEKS